MTPAEFQYIKRAVEALEQGTTEVTEIKILKTISQITAASAQKLEQNLVDKVDELLYNTTN
jgi:phosphoribosylformylglycinamidine (FGAM) synthase PurS component